MNNLVGGVLGFITLSLIARHLGAEELGVLGFGLSFLGMFTFISNLGFDSSHNKRVSEGMDLKQCMGAYGTIKVGLTLLMAAFSLLWIQIYVRFFDGFSGNNEETVVYIFLVYYILWSLSWIPITTFNAQRKQAKAQLPGIIELLVRAPLIVVLVLTGYGIVWVAGAYAIGALVLLFVGFIFLRGYRYTLPSREMLSNYAIFALPMSIISINAVFYLYMDKLMIGIFWNAEEVGFYYGAQRIIMFVITSSAAVAILLFPTISSLHAKGNIKEINLLVSRAERYLSMLIFPIIALTIALNEPIIDLILGDEFGDSGMILVFLALYALLAILNKPYSQVLTGSGRTGLAVRISTAIFATNLFLNLAFIPENIGGIALLGLGGLGAAAATFLSDLGRFVLLRKESKEIIGSTFHPGPMVKHLLSAAGAAAIMLGVSTLVSSDLSLILLIPELFTGLIIYLGFLVLLKEFRKEDYEFFMDMVHPGKMGGYILSEIKE
jgi:O-antigen/teichoic acid export membrane protein